MDESKVLTKIIATLGPASSDEAKITDMIRAGADVFRLNFSHGKHEDHLLSINLVRSAAKKLGVSVGLLADLQGPKIRLGDIENGAIQIAEGDLITIKCGAPFIGRQRELYLSYEFFPRDVIIGNLVLIDDGKMHFEVTGSDGKTTVTLRAKNSGQLSSRKGVNLPDTKVSLPSLTPKDILDAQFALTHGADWIALSFVRKAEDILALRSLLLQSANPPRIISKIEKPEAIENFNSILEVTDAVMIARGDLGVEVPFYQVPSIQKKIIKQCNQALKPVIVATQMLESMISSPTPTRAEAGDIANACLEGTNAVMLSGETAVGKYPVEAVRRMNQVLAWTEMQDDYQTPKIGANKI